LFDQVSRLNAANATSGSQRAPAVQVTVVVPTGKVEPEGGLQTTDCPDDLLLLKRE